jgi:phytoene/squalene synthetase
VFPALPFSVRRPFLILRDLIASRDRPDLAELKAIDDPHRFVWAILPHAARTFAVCIALLPDRSALAAAVAYLYCRMLDTYEDLVPDRAAREAALAAFASRFDAPAGAPLPPAPAIDHAVDHDDRDRAHLLLVRRADRVDQVYLSLDDATRRVVRDLVRDMANGMRWSSTAFASHGGVLPDSAHLAQYCRHVLGNPVVFSVRLLRMRYGATPELTPEEREHAMLVGEMVQLANITRDIEKDLRRGIAYDPLLRADVGIDTRRSKDAALAARIRSVRGRLVLMALERAASYRRVVAEIPLPKWSVARASAVLMFLFTERHFRHDANRAGLRAWTGPESTVSLLMRSIPATFSTRRANAEMIRIEDAFLRACRRSAELHVEAGSAAAPPASRLPAPG